MPRAYVVTFDAVSVSAAQDLFEIAPADDKPVKIAGLVLSNVGGTADAGDAQEELLRLAIIRGTSTSGSGGSSFTPLSLNATAQAAGFAAEINNTTPSSSGTAANLFTDGWNVRMPYQVFFPEELMPECSQANGVLLTVKLVTAPADAISVSGTLFVLENG